MTEDKPTKTVTEVHIKPNSITKRASQSARKFIRRQKQTARKSGLGNR